MIAIVNKGPHDDPDSKGERDYEVKINREVIATFKHRRGDGLAACLMRAAEAVLSAQATAATLPPNLTATRLR